MIIGLVCRHVAAGGQTPRLVSHQKPADPDDTGFLIACGAEGHQTEDWMVEDLSPLFDLPALAELRELPQGQHAMRSAPGQPWLVEPLPAEDEAA